MAFALLGAVFGLLQTFASIMSAFEEKKNKVLDFIKKKNEIEELKEKSDKIQLNFHEERTRKQNKRKVRSFKINPILTDLSHTGI